VKAFLVIQRETVSKHVIELEDSLSIASGAQIGTGDGVVIYGVGLKLACGSK
jgi:hypothetical protein